MFIRKKERMCRARAASLLPNTCKLPPYVCLCYTNIPIFEKGFYSSPQHHITTLDATAFGSSIRLRPCIYVDLAFLSSLANEEQNAQIRSFSHARKEGDADSVVYVIVDTVND